MHSGAICTVGPYAQHPRIPSETTYPAGPYAQWGHMHNIHAYPALPHTQLGCIELFSGCMFKSGIVFMVLLHSVGLSKETNN